MKKVALLWLPFVFNSIITQKADLIIFSFDRPLQLYALLESTERYIKNIGEIHVFYRSSNERYDRAYDDVFSHFSSIQRTKQSDRPNQDFKPLLLNIFSQMREEYILFAVDDIIIQDYVDCAECIVYMNQIDAYGFYLRMGKNITHCYSRNKTQRIPRLYELAQDVYSWTFSDADAEDDWAYPHTVDMTIYRKKDIAHDLALISYQTPNYLEASWHALSGRIMHKKGLCYSRSKIVNLPLNIVREEWRSNEEILLSTEQLLKLFEDGLTMDVAHLSINNTAPHMAYIPIFIERFKS